MKRYEVIGSIINEHKLETIVEIGVREGETMEYLLNNCPSITNYCAVDNNPHAIFISKFNTSNNCIFNMIGESHQMAMKVGDGFADLVFIDASHDYNSVKSDIESWLPKVKKGGFMTGHDYENNAHPDVKKVVDKVFGNRVIQHNHGAYVWVVKV